MNPQFLFFDFSAVCPFALEPVLSQTSRAKFPNYQTGRPLPPMQRFCWGARGGGHIGTDFRPQLVSETFQALIATCTVHAEGMSLVKLDGFRVRFEAKRKPKGNGHMGLSQIGHLQIG